MRRHVITVELLSRSAGVRRVADRLVRHAAARLLNDFVPLERRGSCGNDTFAVPDPDTAVTGAAPDVGPLVGKREIQA